MEINNRESMCWAGGGLGAAVPVHGHRDRALIVLPGGVQVRARQVGGVESPGGLQRRGGGSAGGAL